MSEADAQLLMRFLDGECTDEECERVEQRLKENPQAAQELAEMREQQQSWQALPSVLTEQEVNDDWDELKKKILTEEPEIEPKRPINWLSWSQYWTWGAAAAVFVLASSVAFFLPRSDPPGPIAPPATSYNVVETVETDLDDATPIIYVDSESGWSVVWVDEGAAS